MIQLRYANNSRWNVFSASDQLSLQFPQLPDTYAALRPLNVNLIDHRDECPKAGRCLPAEGARVRTASLARDASVVSSATPRPVTRARSES